MLEKILNILKPYKMVTVGCSVRKGGAGWYSPGETRIFFTKNGIEKEMRNKSGYGCVVKEKTYYFIPVIPTSEKGLTIEYDREFF